MFEGIEKKFEVLVSGEPGSLRELGLPFWKRVIGKANATVLSTVSNATTDAYLLSESSLFVYDRRAIMITCGKTTLVNAVKEMLTGIPAAAIESFIFERKNENFPQLQLTTFDEDVDQLHPLLPGTALRFGDPDGHHLSLYHLNEPFDPADDDTTLEILMYGLEDEVRGVFQELEGHEEARKRFRERTVRLLPGFTIDDHFFDPYGYSMNAIRDSTYATVHVTPENPGSYASFETNVRLSAPELDQLVALVVNLFSPERFDLVSFQEKIVFQGLAGKYRLEDEETRELGCGYRLQFSHFGRRPAPETPKGDGAATEAQDPQPMDLWVEERHRDIFSTKFRVENVLFSGESPFQKVEVVETAGFGRMLLNDGMVMLSERDEFIYHDMISHVPLFVHPKPERVLVIGGGDGGTAREVLRHTGVRHCRMVEIDEMVVDACRKFIPQTAGCLDDPRLTLSIDDGVKFMAETPERYDVVLVDSTDPVGPAAPLFGHEFYGNVHRVLADDGIVISQGGSPFLEMETLRSILRIQSELFDHTHAYTYTNLTYPAGYWSFTYASKGLCPIRDFRKDAVKGSGLRFSYYNPGVHTAAFSLPEFVHRELEGWLSPCP